MNKPLGEEVLKESSKQQASEPPTDVLDVLIVGAGLSGIGAAAMLRRQLPAKRIGIVEARGAIGGTWDLFRYPGVRSDSDMYTLGYAAKPWTSTQSIVAGPDIRRYIEEMAQEHDLVPLIRFGTEVVAADWDSAQSLWRVTLKDVASGATHIQHARFLHFCNGYYRYREGHRPSWPGEAEYRGRIVHPQFWPEDLDHAGKRVLVIGSGATAITLVPAMAEQAARVTMLQRSPSYVVSRPAHDGLAKLLGRVLPARWAYSLVRWKNILLAIALFALARSRPEGVRRRIAAMAGAQLPAGYEVQKHFNPRYKPWDQRVCLVPDGDLFRAIRKGRVDVVTDTLERFTPNGVVLASGQQIEADIVVTATGLELNAPASIAVRVDGQPVDWSRTMAYKGTLFTDVPNLMQTFGYTNASWTLRADLIAQYLCRLLALMDRRGQRVAWVQRDPAVQERPFLDFTSGYVQRSVALLPRQGDRGPWRVHQNYLRDLLAVRFAPVDDGVLRLGRRYEPNTGASAATSATAATGRTGAAA